MQSETGPYQKRDSWHTFAQWVALGGGRVRGVNPEMQRGYVRGYCGSAEQVEPVEGSAELFYSSADERMRDHVPALQVVLAATRKSSRGRLQRPAAYSSVPLQLIDVGDSEQTEFIFNLLRKVPHVIQHYLYTIIFPETMEFQESRLSANGQELGGDLIFGTRLGFSGTPSDLLPIEFQPCNYERGDDANMLHVLTSTEVVDAHYMNTGWSVEKLLDAVATADPPFNALIDTGALITGMSNYEVAVYLLENGLTSMEGVVFLDENDVKMILLRTRSVVMKLEQCGIGLGKRFSFYDQVLPPTFGNDSRAQNPLMKLQSCFKSSAAVTVLSPCTTRCTRRGWTLSKSSLLGRL